ncbi:VOC family protein [Candidatus Regiella insecticola]|uniref:VOC family protein n=1 Tax=Candidatus Regiella insecticola TaxID=138073 RepID=UPI001F26C79E|nr:VOC family protein [Candidatus Regiella insecticola]
MTDPQHIDVSIAFLEIPNTGVFLELMEYHSPVGKTNFERKKTNDIGGIGHICLKVKKIDEAFDYIKKHNGTTLINNSPEYKPYKIDKITAENFIFFDEEYEKDKNLKEKTCKIVGNIKYFYFIDKYGIQWEFEEGHNDIGND